MLDSNIMPPTDMLGSPKQKSTRNRLRKVSFFSYYVVVFVDGRLFRLYQLTTVRLTNCNRISYIPRTNSKSTGPPSMPLSATKTSATCKPSAALAKQIKTLWGLTRAAPKWSTLQSSSRRSKRVKQTFVRIVTLADYFLFKIVNSPARNQTNLNLPKLIPG